MTRCHAAIVVASLAVAFAAVHEANGQPGNQSVYFVDPQPEATLATIEKLARGIGDAAVQFREMPLEEAIAFLEDESGIQIVLDLAALSELGLSAEEPVTFRLRNGTYDVVLDHVLEPLELTYTVSGGVILVTTEENAASRSLIAVYPVIDLVEDGEYTTLVDTITDIIASDTWSKNGDGAGAIHAIPQRGSLVISQTFAVHTQVKQLLEALRRAPAQDVAAAAEPRPAHAGFGGPQGAEFRGYGGDFGGGRPAPRGGHNVDANNPFSF
ncbi:DUF4974 domain-containing protein [Botrimarina sp.]|uniref:DUF4974 domain-containing protein n=1 Tax=Botrimarina sp. TaxID=2795802 RepID=UPI0032F02B82